MTADKRINRYNFGSIHVSHVFLRNPGKSHVQVSRCERRLSTIYMKATNVRNISRGILGTITSQAFVSTNPLSETNLILLKDISHITTAYDITNAVHSDHCLCQSLDLIGHPSKHPMVSA